MQRACIYILLYLGVTVAERMEAVATFVVTRLRLIRTVHHSARSMFSCERLHSIKRTPSSYNYRWAIDIHNADAENLGVFQLCIGSTSRNERNRHNTH